MVQIRWLSKGYDCTTNHFAIAEIAEIAEASGTCYWDTKGCKLKFESGIEQTACVVPCRASIQRVFNKDGCVNS